MSLNEPKKKKRSLSMYSWKEVSFEAIYGSEMTPFDAPSGAPLWRCMKRHDSESDVLCFCSVITRFEKNGSMLPGKFMIQDGLKAIYRRGSSRELSGDSLEKIWLMSTFYTGGEVIVRARNGEMFTLDTSTLFDFATSILLGKGDLGYTLGLDILPCVVF